ncbi:uncharacterized protein LOC144568087 [Carex rostrata]
MKDRLPRPIRQHISLKEAIPGEGDIISAYTGTVPVLQDHEDELIWRWTTSKKYSAGSIYKLLITTGKVRWGFREVWAASAPSKVKIFAALLLENRILTRERLQTRHINCEDHCVMCDMDTLETSHHLFFQCVNAREVWACVGDVMQEEASVQETWEASMDRYGSKQGNQRQIWIVLFMAVLWSIWRQRNEVIFRGTKLPVRLVANRAKEEAQLWQRFCKRGKQFVVNLGIDQTMARLV